MAVIWYLIKDILRAVCFVFERARAPRHFLLGKGHPMMKLQICTGAFQGHQGNDQGTSVKYMYHACILYGELVDAPKVYWPSAKITSHGLMSSVHFMPLILSLSVVFIPSSPGVKRTYSFYSPQRVSNVALTVVMKDNKDTASYYTTKHSWRGK